MTKFVSLCFFWSQRLDEHIQDNLSTSFKVAILLFAVETEQPPLPNLFPSGDINLLVYESLTLVCNVSVPKDTHIRFKFSYRTQEEEVTDSVMWRPSCGQLFKINDVVSSRFVQDFKWQY